MNLFKTTIAILAIFCDAASISAQKPPRPTPETLFEDFEHDTYEGWTLTGDLRAMIPASFATFPGAVSGVFGTRFATTFHPTLGNRAKGRIVSRSFIIDRPTIGFRIAGGNYPGKACLDLMIEGESTPVLSETGDNTLDLSPREWDVSRWMGRTAHFEMVDETDSARRGHVSVDRIVFRGEGPKRDVPDPIPGTRDTNPTERTPVSIEPIDPAAEAAVVKQETVRLATSTIESMILGSINYSRLRNGLKPLAVHPALTLATADSAADRTDHSGKAETSYGASHPVRLQARGYTGQILGSGTISSFREMSPAAVAQRMRNWRSSDRAYAVDADYIKDERVVCCGVAQGVRESAGEMVSWRTIYGDGPACAGCLIPFQFHSEAQTGPQLQCFPVLTKAQYSNDFGDDRGDHKHQGNDLVAPKMRPLVACFDGRIAFALDESGRTSQGHTIYLSSDSGWSATYMHVNDDTPGTNDNRGGWKYAFAEGLKNGDMVRAGQLIGYVGDSGNARGGVSHCHFELSDPSGNTVNPYTYLRATGTISKPKDAWPAEEWKSRLSRLQKDGEIRMDGVIKEVRPGEIVIEAESYAMPDGKVVVFKTPARKVVKVPVDGHVETRVEVGKRVIVSGKDGGSGKALTAAYLIVVV